MLSRKRLGILVLAVLLAVQGAYAEMPDPNDPNEVILPLPLGDVLGAIADDLVADQLVNDNWPGTGWPGMENYNGAITQGMVSAYNIFGDNAYGASAESGCGWLYFDTLVQTPLGDSVLAWDVFGSSGYVHGDEWNRTAAWFFENVRVYTPGGAAAYAASFGGDAASTVYYLANLTLAAYGVDAEEKAIWRAGLASELAIVADDTAIFPVQAIGTATWALATTGPLDDTTLPDTLVSHQVPADGYDPGSFYWRIDHTGGDANLVAEGYTQDAIFAVLGLYAAADANPEIVPALQAPIVDGVKAILASLGTDGLVYEHLSLGGQASYVYAAQILLLSDILGLSLDVDLNALDEISTYEDLGIVLDSPIVWNPSFEIPGTTKQTNFEGVLSWTSGPGEVTDSGVEEGWTATDGTWTAFLKGADPEVYQITRHVIEAADIIELTVDSRITWQATTLELGMFYIDDAGMPVIVASSQVALTEAMANYGLVFVAADAPDAVGRQLGIGFDNVTVEGASWLGLDSVMVDFLAEVPDPNAGL